MLASDHPRNYDRHRIARLDTQFRRADKGRVQANRLWNNYMYYPLKALKERTDLTGDRIISELRRLAEAEPSRWDANRIHQLENEYAAQKTREYVDPKIYRKMLKREEKWNERDIHILGATYFSRGWLELAKIFRYKSKEVQTELRELHDKNPGSWDIGRIAELEDESLKYSVKEIRESTGYYAPEYHLRVSPERAFTRRVGLPRRPEIDSLIEQGMNKSQIAKKVHLSAQAIAQYIKSRNLTEMYNTIRRQSR
jgi:hypothetical protein